MITLPRFTKAQWITMISVGGVDLAAGICISFQAPFYPHEAESKGATATEYGLVIGIYELTAFISSPIFGKYIDSIGAKNLQVVGLFVASLHSVLFGLLDGIDGHDLFIGLSFAVRIVQALGTYAAMTTSMSLLAAVFPNSVASAFAALTMVYGFAYVIGPTSGEALYTLGGYKLPFMALGCMMLLNGLFSAFLLPSIDDGLSKDRRQAKLWPFLKIPAVVLALISTTVGTVSTGYYAATLEPHIRMFDLTSANKGFFFMISGAIYAITAPLVGRVCNSRVNPKKVIVFGNLLLILSFILVGPVPFTPIPTTLWMCCVGMALCGMGHACITVSTFVDAFRSSIAHGLPDDITTYGVVSGLWTSAFALGAFIGPSVAGALFDWVGFRQGTLFVIAAQSIVILSMVTFICMERQQPPPTPPTLTSPSTPTSTSTYHHSQPTT